MGHKIARAYGYATHIKPQGFISRLPLLTTNKVFFIRILLILSQSTLSRGRQRTTVGHSHYHGLGRPQLERRYAGGMRALSRQFRAGEGLARQQEQQLQTQQQTQQQAQTQQEQQQQQPQQPPQQALPRGY